MGDPIGVVLAEDHYLVREGTRQVLEAAGDVKVLAAIGTAHELLDAVNRLRPDAVLTDIRMPPDHHMEGIQAAHEIRQRYSTVGVVVLSQHADAAYAFALLEHGTAGLAYLLKERVTDRAELIRALQETIAGRSVIDPVVVEALMRRRVRQATSPLRDLTPRELEVLSQMAQGRTNLAIAQRLHLSQSSIEKHVSTIFAKTGLAEEEATNRRVAAVLTYLREEAGGHPAGPPPESSNDTR